MIGKKIDGGMMMIDEMRDDWWLVDGTSGDDTVSD